MYHITNGNDFHVWEDRNQDKSEVTTFKRRVNAATQHDVYIQEYSELLRNL